MVYKLVAKHKKEGSDAYKAKKAGKPKISINPSFVKKVVEIRKSMGIGFWTSRRNHPQTNGKIEKWFDTMKKRKKKHPDETLQEFVKWYNDERIHHALGYKTPEEVYRENL